MLASAVMAFPLTVQPVRLAFALIDPRLDRPLRRWAQRPGRCSPASLPLAIPGIVAGAILSFSRSLGEFGATMAFVGNIPGETRTRRWRFTPIRMCRTAKPRRSAWSCCRSWSPSLPCWRAISSRGAASACSDAAHAET